MSLASRWSRRTFVALTVAFAIAACTTARADDAPDPSTPKGVAYAFGQAIEKHDVPAAKALTTGTADDLRMIDGFAAVAAAKAKLHAAAEKKFGKDEVTTGALAGPAQNASVDRFKNAANYDEKIEGDTATLTPKPEAPDAGAPNTQGRARAAVASRAARPLQFKKVDGAWKLDLAGLVNGQNREAFLSVLTAIGKSNAEVADGIDAGTYATNDAAKAALREKMLTAIRASFGNTPRRPGAPAGN